MGPSLRFAVTCLWLTASLLAHSGLTAVVIERSKSGWCRVLSAALLLANGVGVLALLERAF